MVSIKVLEYVCHLQGCSLRFQKNEWQLSLLSLVKWWRAAGCLQENAISLVSFSPLSLPCVSCEQGLCFSWFCIGRIGLKACKFPCKNSLIFKQATLSQPDRQGGQGALAAPRSSGVFWVISAIFLTHTSNKYVDSNIIEVAQLLHMLTSPLLFYAI